MKPIYVLDTNVWLAAIASIHPTEAPNINSYDKQQAKSFRDRGTDLQHVRGQIIYCMTQGTVLVPQTVLEELHAKHAHTDLPPAHNQRLDQLIQLLAKAKSPTRNIPPDEFDHNDRLITELTAAAIHPNANHQCIGQLGAKNIGNWQLLHIPKHNSNAKTPYTSDELTVLANAQQNPRDSELNFEATTIRNAHTLKIWTDFAVLSLAHQHQGTAVSLDCDLANINTWMDHKLGRKIDLTTIGHLGCREHNMEFKKFTDTIGRITKATKDQTPKGIGPDPLAR